MNAARPYRLLARACLFLPLLVVGLDLVSAAPGAAAARLRLEGSSPQQGAAGVAGTASISLQFSSALLPSTVDPVITPRVGGAWAVHGRALVFTPAGAFPPDATVSVTVPGGPRGVLASDGAALRRTTTLRFETADGSVLRAEQLLATLDYLPVSWRPTRTDPSGRAAYERAVFDPPRGRFRAIGQMPTQLRALWQPGTASPVYHSALAAFQAASGLSATGALSGPTWASLLAAARVPGRHASSTGFTYAVVNQRLPETLTVWRGGRVVLNTLANTGIAASPTADGTFPVYEKAQSQIMTGTTPWGTTYSDPVEFINYFNGSDAVHYMDRSSYGYPQSFGCVEVPFAAAQQAYRELGLGTLVTVIGP